jgi:hypothetical protein
MFSLLYILAFKHVSLQTREICSIFDTSVLGYNYGMPGVKGLVRNTLYKGILCVVEHYLG